MIRLSLLSYHNDKSLFFVQASIKTPKTKYPILTMIRICFLLLLGTSQVNLSLTNQPTLDKSFVRSHVNLSLFKTDFRDGSIKSLLSDIVYGYLIRELTKISNFPTIVANNISEQCQNDSRDYRTANLNLENWANQSNASFTVVSFLCKKWL